MTNKITLQVVILNDYFTGRECVIANTPADITTYIYGYKVRGLTIKCPDMSGAKDLDQCSQEHEDTQSLIMSCADEYVIEQVKPNINITALVPEDTTCTEFFSTIPPENIDKYYNEQIKHGVSMQIYSEATELTGCEQTDISP